MSCALHQSLLSLTQGLVERVDALDKKWQQMMQESILIQIPTGRTMIPETFQSLLSYCRLVFDTNDIVNLAFESWISVLSSSIIV